MIHEAKRSDALEAMYMVLVLARTMAYQHEPHAALAEVLDAAEYLVRLMLDDEDRTREFRDQLVDLANKRKEFITAVTMFDTGLTFPR